MTKGTLQIDILGISFKVQADENAAYLQELLTYFSQVVRQIETSTPGLDPLKVAILAGMTLSDEVKKLEQSQTKMEGMPEPATLLEIEKITGKMINKISEVL